MKRMNDMKMINRPLLMTLSTLLMAITLLVISALSGGYCVHSYTTEYTAAPLVVRQWRRG